MCAIHYPNESMNTILSSLILWASGVVLMFFGASQMQVRGASETDGSSSLIAENIRSRGSQSFGIGLGMIGIGCMSMKANSGKSDEGQRE